MAQSLGISAAEVAFSLRRLKKHHLVNLNELKINPGAFCEFLIHGVKYVFPADIGRLVRGIPTGSSHPTLVKKLRVPPEQVLVWPHPDGEMRGQSLQPIYSSAPFAAKNDPKLYELLSLLDTIRVGGARETKLASEIIEKLLLKSEK